MIWLFEWPCKYALAQRPTGRGHALHTQALEDGTQDGQTARQHRGALRLEPFELYRVDAPDVDQNAPQRFHTAATDLMLGGPALLLQDAGDGLMGRRGRLLCGRRF